MARVALSASSATVKSPYGAGANRLPPTVAALRIAGPPAARAAGCRNASSRWARTCAMVAPAPMVMRAPAGRISAKLRSVARTIVASDASPSLIARITSVPPARKRALRSDASAEAASPMLAKVFTVIGIVPRSRSSLDVASNRIEARLVDLDAHHRDHLRSLAGASGEARFPAPERAVPVGHGQQPHVRHVVEQRNRRIEQAVAEGLLEVRQGQQLLAQLRAVLQAKAAHATDLVGRRAALDRAGGDRRVPALVAVEVAQHRPHPVDRGVDDGAFHDVGHGLSAPERPLERVEAALEHAGPDRRRQLGLALRRAVELGGPFGKSALAVGDRREAQGRDIVLDPHRRLQDRVGAEHVIVREPEQALADAVAVAQPEVAHTPDLVGRLAVLDPALRDRRVPVRQAVEVADAAPHPIAAGVDDARYVDARHRAQAFAPPDLPRPERPLGLSPPPSPLSDLCARPTLSLMPCRSRAS